MPATIYGTFPLLLPGKTESISRNGLKRVSGTIAYLAGGYAEALELAETFGTVFPAPQSRTADNGIHELSFEAFSSNGTFSYLHGTELLNFSKSFEDTTGNRWQINETWLADTFTTFNVVAAQPSGTVIPSVVYNISKVMRTRTISGTQGSGASQLSISWSNVIKSISRRNFGNIDEIDIVYGADGIVL